MVPGRRLQGGIEVKRGVLMSGVRQGRGLEMKVKGREREKAICVLFQRGEDYQGRVGVARGAASAWVGAIGYFGSIVNAVSVSVGILRIGTDHIFVPVL